MKRYPSGSQLPDVYVDGGTVLYEEAGQRFIECAVTGLADVDSEVTFVIPVLDAASYEALDLARKIGLRQGWFVFH